MLSVAYIPLVENSSLQLFCCTVMGVMSIEFVLVLIAEEALKLKQGSFLKKKTMEN